MKGGLITNKDPPREKAHINRSIRTSLSLRKTLPSNIDMIGDMYKMLVTSDMFNIGIPVMKNTKAIEPSNLLLLFKILRSLYASY
jgi:hypothetical protein